MIATANNNRSLRFDSTGAKVGPDRENGVLRGLVLAQAMTFKTGRGRFNLESLRTAERLLQREGRGVPSHFRHPSPPASDGLGLFLGRIKSTRLDGDKLRGDLWFDPTAFDEPIGGGRPFADYLLALADSDERAAGASFVLVADKSIERDARGRTLADRDGAPLAPLWTPREIQSCDVVGKGDATSAMLCMPREVSHDELLRIRWEYKKRTAGLDLPDADLLRRRWANMKRKAGV